MRRLFREATTSFSHLALSPPHQQKSYVHCMRRSSRPLMCSNIPTMISLFQSFLVQSRAYTSLKAMKSESVAHCFLSSSVTPLVPRPSRRISLPRHAARLPSTTGASLPSFNLSGLRHHTTARDLVRSLAPTTPATGAPPCCPSTHHCPLPVDSSSPHPTSLLTPAAIGAPATSER